MTTDIRYIVLSDAHLGAANSILTPTKVERDQAGTVMSGLIDCLATLVAGNQGGRLRDRRAANQRLLESRPEMLGG